MSQLQKRWFVVGSVVCLLASLGVGWSCSSNPVGEATCAEPADCSGPQVCQDGYCVRPEDEDKPTLTWLTPMANTPISGEVTLSVEASDPTTSVSAVRFGGVSESIRIGADQDGSDGWDTTWDTTEVSDGEFVISATAVDALGNERTKERTVTIDNTLPVIDVVAPEESQHIQGDIDPSSQSGFEVQWCLDTADPLLASNPFSLALRTSPQGSFEPLIDGMGNNATGLAYAEGGDDCDTSTDATEHTQVFEWPVPDVSGPVTLRVSAQTATGETATGTRNFTIDSDFPQFGDPPLSRSGGDDIPTSGAEIDGELNMVANVTDQTSEVASVDFVVTNGAGDVVFNATDDGSQDGTFSATWQTASASEGVADGTYDLDLTATDAVGNTSSTSGGDGQTTTVTVNNGGPNVEITSPSADQVVSGSSASVEANVVETTTPIAQTELLVEGSSVEVDQSAGGTFTWDTTNAPNGEVTVAVEAEDANGNVGSDSVSVVVDNEAPNSFQISNYSGGEYVGGSMVSIMASTTDTHTSVQTYEFVVDGTVTTSTPAGQYSGFMWDTTAVSDGSYQIAVRAIDEAGNEQQTSTIQLNVDNTGPGTVSFTDPVMGATVGGDVDVTVSASDAGSGIQSITINAPQSTLGPQTGTNMASFTWDSTNAASGTGKQLQAVAVDQVGNQSTTMITVTVDNDPPSISFVDPAPTETIGGMATVNLDVSDSLGSISSVTVTESGTQIGSPSGPNYEFSWDTTTTASASTTINATATDGQGNSASASVDVTIDNVAPSNVEFNSPGPMATVGGDVNVEVTASDADSTISSIELEGPNGMTVGTSQSNLATFTWDSTTGSEGQKTLTAIATDAAGNTANATRTVIVDNTAPSSVNITSHNNGETVTGSSVTLTAEATDSSNITMSFNVDGQNVGTATGSPGSVPWDTTASGFTDGTATVEVVVEDAAGNTSTDTVDVVIDNPENITFLNPVNNGCLPANTTVTIEFEVEGFDTDGDLQVQLNYASTGGPSKTFSPADWSPNSTLTIDWTTPNQDPNPDPLELQVDGANDSTTNSISVQVQNSC